MKFFGIFYVFSFIGSVCSFYRIIMPYSKVIFIPWCLDKFSIFPDQWVFKPLFAVNKAPSEFAFNTGGKAANTTIHKYAFIGYNLIDMHLTTLRTNTYSYYFMYVFRKNFYWWHSFEYNWAVVFGLGHDIPVTILFILLAIIYLKKVDPPNTK